MPSYRLKSDVFVFESAEAAFVGLADMAEWTFRDGVLSGPCALPSGLTSIALRDQLA